jgi:tRNA dimethylallyltransferase
LAEIQGRGKLPILVGGTGLYLDAILRKYQMTEVPANYELRKESINSPLGDLAARLKASNPKLHNTTDLLDRERLIRAIEIAEYKRETGEVFPLPELKPVVFGIFWPREILHQRISQRLRERMNQGMIEEGKRLLESGVSFRTLDFYGLEYRFIAKYLAGELNRNDLFQKLGSAIRQFAKRQQTWFRRMERQGMLIHWVEGDKDPAMEILRILKGKAIAQ